MTTAVMGSTPKAEAKMCSRTLGYLHLKGLGAALGALGDVIKPQKRVKNE